MKKIINAVVAFALFFTSLSFSFANEKISDTELIGPIGSEVRMKVVKVDEDFDLPESLTVLGVPAKYTKGININGTTYNLYPEFTNQANALKAAREHFVAILEQIRTENNLAGFDDNTWREYYGKIYLIEEKVLNNNLYSEEEKENLLRLCFDLRNFFDLYENKDSNSEIMDFLIDKVQLNVISLATATDRTIGNDILYDLGCMLPYNTGGDKAIELLIAENSEVIQNNDPNYVSPLSYSGNYSFNVTKGVSYAETYAVNANITDYGSVTSGIYIDQGPADCTNFVSQIKYEGGVPLYKTINDSDGWTFWKNEASSRDRFKYTTRWAAADAFAKFFGEKAIFDSEDYGNNQYKAFSAFSKAVSKGSFIAYDGLGDGSWTHMGFVTATSSTMVDFGDDSNYNYKNFKVAQHTGNYLEWVNAPQNHWEVGSNITAWAIIN